MAALLDVSAGLVAKFENPPPWRDLKYEDLLRYQLHYGCPVSVIVLIAQILAAARDGARDGTDDQLRVLGSMVKVLHGKLATPADRETLMKHFATEEARQKWALWDNLLGELVMDGYLTVANKDENKKAFENHTRLKQLNEDREAAADLRRKARKRREERETKRGAAAQAKRARSRT